MWKGLEKMHENQPKTSYMFMTLLDFSERFGAELVKETLAAFRCEKNQAVENFLRENAMDFSRKRQSIDSLLPMWSCVSQICSSLAIFPSSSNRCLFLQQ